MFPMNNNTSMNRGDKGTNTTEHWGGISSGGDRDIHGGVSLQERGEGQCKRYLQKGH